MDRWREEAAEAGPRRLDVVVAERYDRARNQVQAWIRAGRVLVDGKPGKPSSAIAGDEWIECDPVAVADRETMEPEAGPLTVLYEDDDVVVLDKPAGLAVHPGAGRTRGTLAHRLLARYPEMAGVGGPGRPGIVHRLDLDTTGALVVARTVAAYRALSAAFSERRVAKTYLAIAYGRPEPAAGTIEAPLGRHPQRRKEMAVRPGGRPAKTGYRTLATSSGIAVLEIDLLTGRTHQIRVHLKHAGHPLVGDPVYGEARWKGLPPAIRTVLAAFPRPALHARRVVFSHPTRAGHRVDVEAPVAPDLLDLWRHVAGMPWPAETTQRTEGPSQSSSSSDV